MKSIAATRATLLDTQARVFPYNVLLRRDLSIEELNDLFRYLHSLGNRGSQFAPRRRDQPFYYPLSARWDFTEIAVVWFRDSHDATLCRLFWGQ